MAAVQPRRSSALGDLAASALVAGVQQLAQWLPERRLLAAARTLGFLLYYVLRFRRTVVDARIAAAFADGRATSEQQRRIARDAYVHLSLSLLWFLRLPALDRARVAEDLVDFGGSDVHAFRERVIGAGCNAILLTGHVGMWELLPEALADPRCEQWVVYRPLHQIALDRIVAGIRSGPQRHLVPDKSCFALLQSTLRSTSPTAQLVGLVGDHRAAGSSAAEVTFLGQRTRLPTGAARLQFSSAASSSSLWFGALLHNAEFYRSPASSSSAKPFRLVLREIPVPPPAAAASHDPAAAEDSTTAVAAITQSYAHLLEQVVLQHPAQYLWLHNLWIIKALVVD